MKRSEYAYSSSRPWLLYSGNTVKISWQLERPLLKYSVLSISKLSEKQYSGNRHLQIKTLNHEKVNIIKLLKSLKINLFSIRFFSFFLSIYFHRHWRFAGQQRKGVNLRLFHATTSTRSWTFRQLFPTLHVKWDCYSHLRLLLDEIYYLIELPFDWLIDDSIFVCLLDYLILGFLLQQFHTGNRWIWTHIDYRPWITSEPTNQYHYYLKHSC